MIPPAQLDSLDRIGFAVGLIGFVLLVAGIGVIYWPGALIAAGAGLLAWSYLTARAVGRGRDRRES